MSNTRVEILGWIVLLVVILFIVLVSPAITIWSINTLFHTEIPVNLYTYLATLWLTGLVAGGNIRSK